MKKILLTTALLLLSATVASAQASRTWVSGVGDDANPCSRTAPCKTFAGAISKTAAGGEISVLDPAGFGAVTITKSITINGYSNIAGILAAGTNGIVINAAATDTVYIKDVSIVGFGTGLNGIRILNAGTVHIEGVQINGFTQKGIVASNTGNLTLLVKDTVISNCRGASGGGIHLIPTSPATVTGMLDNVRSNQSTFGLKAEDRTNITVRNSDFSNNENNGVIATSVSAAAVINLEECVAANNRNATNNSSGVQSFGANSIVRLSNVDVFNNNIGLNPASGGSIVSFLNNRVTQNGSTFPPTATVPPI